MPRRRRRADDRDESTVVQNPSLLASKARALRVGTEVRARRATARFRRNGSGAIWFRLERVEANRGF